MKKEDELARQYGYHSVEEAVKDGYELFYSNGEPCFYRHTMTCPQCGQRLTNLADLGDYDEGFHCGDCGQDFDHNGEEC